MMISGKTTKIIQGIPSVSPELKANQPAISVHKTIYMSYFQNFYSTTEPTFYRKKSFQIRLIQKQEKQYRLPG